jgi:hypothetical protein
MRGLKGSLKVSIVVEPAENGEPVRGLVLEGPAEVISDPAVIGRRSASPYTRYPGEENARQPGRAFRVAPPDRWLIRVEQEQVFARGQDQENCQGAPRMGD